MKTEDDVATAIRGMAKIYDRAIEAETIAFYAEVLLGVLTADEAFRAIGRWSASEARWPAPVQIIELVKPKAVVRDIAGDMSQDLLRLIGQRGHTWESTYRYDGHASIEAAILAEVGDAGLNVVRRSGGWANFCREWGREQGDTATRAQLRGLCESAAKSGHVDRTALPSRNDPKRDLVGEFIEQQKQLRARQS